MTDGPPTAAAVALALFANAFTPLNTDLGWMLSFGRGTVAAGALMGENVESFTSPGYPIVNSEWGSCVVLYLLHAHWGAAGVIALKWLLTALVVAGIFQATRTAQSGLVRLLVTLLATSLMWIGFELVRSQLFTFALLSFVVVAGVGRGRWPLWACVPVLGLWANLHAGFVSGLVVLSALCATHLIEQRLGWKPVTMRSLELATIPVLGLVATLATPYGFGLWAANWLVVADPNLVLVREWLPLWRVGELATGEFVGLGGFAGVIALCALLVSRRELRLWVLCGLAVVAGVSASRNLRLAPILLAPVVAYAVDAARKRLLGDQPLRLERLVPWICGAATVGFGSLWLTRAPQALHFIEPAAPSPAAAIVVMLQNDLHGKIWNDYDWGGYLLWSDPDSRVACDGRFTLAYPAAVISENINLGRRGAPPPLQVLEKYGAELVLLPPTDPAMGAISARFQPLYCDKSACLLSSRPEDLRRRADLRIPDFAVGMSDLFDRAGGPGPEFRGPR